MDSIGEENGNSNNIEEGHNLTTTSTQQQQHQSNNSSNSTAGNSVATSAAGSGATVLTTTASVQYPLAAPVHSLQQMQSVIQAANQSSVIQTAATNAVTAVTTGTIGVPKGGVLYVNKPPSTTVIHTTSGSGVQLPPHFQCKIKPEPNTQHLDTNSEDSLTDEDSPQRRIELTRRPSYNKIFTEISGPDITGGATLQMSETGGLHTLSSTGGGTSGTLIQMPPDNAAAFYIPHRIPYNTNNSGIAEDQTRKREIRLQKNREAARECRRKKKEYIKCLENRVAVLENQNKALIEELKSLKELYCQTKID
nr:cyclic AMP response element-binding protein B isoform X1 [Bactrocera oleae]XP_036234439.1 cyclic AMP response element-binding protein B isoform X1 [Bactrocera oleae]XP_036234440.1 cyclic AMP response element-binding protein B isoform X1 [Bactrocera oleae]XP_036234442.1 cyclic AMP response element-binding protein B isoform X1 [Bactrocera oleae]XP_036234443.1 cyclic AMP response element-binding protein B isoform X1 [Bactrocera oleae]XP_036234444.1 cyclic AMP response element-binding protein B